MANKKRGQVSVEIGGKSRKMWLTLNDFAELQDRFDGKPVTEILQKLNQMDVRVLRAILHLALRHDDPDLTENQVGDFEFSIADIASKLGECIALSLSGGKEDDSAKGK